MSSGFRHDPDEPPQRKYSTPSRACEAPLCKLFKRIHVVRVCRRHELLARHAIDVQNKDQPNQSLEVIMAQPEVQARAEELLKMDESQILQEPPAVADVPQHPPGNESPGSPMSDIEAAAADSDHEPFIDLHDEDDHDEGDDHEAEVHLEDEGGGVDDGSSDEEAHDLSAGLAEPDPEVARQQIHIEAGGAYGLAIKTASPRDLVWVRKSVLNVLDFGVGKKGRMFSLVNTMKVISRDRVCT